MGKLKTVDLSVNYLGSDTAVSLVNFCTESGLCIYGEQFSGKTALLYALAGLASTQGEIILNGLNIERKSVKERNIGMLFETPALVGETVADAISYPLKTRKSDKRTSELTAENSRLRFCPSVAADAKIKKLGKREKTLVAIAALFTLRRDAYLIDNSFSAFAADEKKAVLSAVKEEIIRQGGVYVYATDDKSELFSASEPIIMLNAGYPTRAAYYASHLSYAECLYDMSVLSEISVLNSNIIYGTNGAECVISDVRYPLKQPLISDIFDKAYVAVYPNDVYLSEGGKLKGKVTACKQRKNGYTIYVASDAGNAVIASETPRTTGEDVSYDIKNEKIRLFDTETEKSIYRGGYD